MQVVSTTLIVAVLLAVYKGGLAFQASSARISGRNNLIADTVLFGRGGGGGGGGGGNANNDNHANQCNPNNSNYDGYSSSYGGTGTQDDLDNHANQLNPEHEAYNPGYGYVQRR